MIIDVEKEVNKHRSCTDREKLERIIQDYKNLALQYAKNIALAGQYNMVAHKLREICDRLPAPNLKNVVSHTSNIPVKTAKITSKEASQIDAAWKQKAGNANKKA